MNVEKPKFPITIVWEEDGEQDVFKNEIDAACTLEWLDSTDSDSGVAVTDSTGRAVTLIVEKSEMKLCQLA